MKSWTKLRLVPRDGLKAKNRFVKYSQNYAYLKSFL